MENSIRFLKKSPKKSKLLNLEEDLIQHIQEKADTHKVSWTRYVRQVLIRHTEYVPALKEETNG